ncbi:MAG: type II secretion system protein [Kiritimatiellia bacterium]
MNTTRRMGLTLIELLVVVAIIGILVGLLFPALARSKEQMKRNRAATEAAALRNAIKAYYLEYGYWPCPESDRRPVPAGLFTYSTNNWQVVNRLRVESPANPKKLLFAELDKIKRNDVGSVVTPWDEWDPNDKPKDYKPRPYIIKLDTRYPGRDCAIVAGVEVTW